MDLKRRALIAGGAAVAATAAVPRVFGLQPGSGGKGELYEKGPVRIYYEQAGSGFPLMLLPGGGLNSTIAFFTGNAPFNAIEEFKGEYRCITADLRNAPSGQSTGPVDVERPWESYADDQLGLMNHLGIDKFMVMGFCIGGPFIWSLLKRAPIVLRRPCSRSQWVGVRRCGTVNTRVHSGRAGLRRSPPSGRTLRCRRPSSL
jgi:pimeloyl-ACP methyl ester carboxylesterase